MPHMPVIAKMPNGTFRIVWADPGAEIALRIDSEARAYIVEVGTEEEFERLKDEVREVMNKTIGGN